VSDHRRRRQQRRHPYEADPDDAGQRPGYYSGYREPGYAPYGDWNADDREVEPPRVRLITPARLLLVLLALLAGGIALFGFLDRTAMQLTIIIVGLGLLGVALLGLSLSLARASAQLGSQGSGGRALLAAFVGGLCILAAAGSLAGAIVLGLLTA
jgi:hypothetical protein